MELNTANERLKHRYVAYLRGGRQLGEHSIDQILSALNRFEYYTRRKGFTGCGRRPPAAGRAQV